MTPGELRIELYNRDVALSVADGALKYSAPDGALTPELLAEMRRHKSSLISILKAEAEYDALRHRIFTLVDAAEANDLYNTHVEAERQRAEARALVQGDYWSANERLLDLLGPEAFAALDGWLLQEMQQEVRL